MEVTADESLLLQCAMYKVTVCTAAGVAYTPGDNQSTLLLCTHIYVDSDLDKNQEDEEKFSSHLSFRR